MISTITTLVFLILGTFFILTASIGILRMPDVYLRISVVTKAATLGVGFMLIGLAVHYENFAITTRALAILLFVFLTGPAAAHMIGRAAYFIGDPLWKKTVGDELKNRYNKQSENLASSDEQAHQNELDMKEKK
ncbi:MAG: monovalent cation/H(+) antiporter subunit G [Bacteroidetes bacterium]|nr:monovalent cation/H(+) antiporter subunit G [Bacteroidota bacterium]HET6244486.1 monovalent cation/H(+) antiporter subunit G [Bacteroidia bacterium]